MGNKQSDHKIVPININLRAEPSSDGIVSRYINFILTLINNHSFN